MHAAWLGGVVALGSGSVNMNKSWKSGGVMAFTALCMASIASSFLSSSSSIVATVDASWRSTCTESYKAPSHTTAASVAHAYQSTEEVPARAASCRSLRRYRAARILLPPPDPLQPVSAWPAQIDGDRSLLAERGSEVGGSVHDGVKPRGCQVRHARCSDIIETLCDARAPHACRFRFSRAVRPRQPIRRRAYQRQLQADLMQLPIVRP